VLYGELEAEGGDKVGTAWRELMLDWYNYHPDIVMEFKRPQPA
jgi:hypothetical protein